LLNKKPALIFFALLQINNVGALSFSSLSSSGANKYLKKK
jgi:hypothetical protein